MNKEKKTACPPKQEAEGVDNSRRSTLKQLGIGALGTVGALYGFNQSALAREGVPAREDGKP
ncbi:MAG: hypothetical protein LUE93_12170 [Bacteroides sp.]|nr:hypothetical protein [Bacteroides sp.]